MIDWALSDQGTGVATWISDVVAAVALIVALRVALVEKRRADEDRRRSEAESDRVRQRFLHTCTTLIGEATAFIDKELDNHPPGGGTVSVPCGSGIGHVIEPILDAAEALQASAPAEGDLVLTLARVVRTLRDLTDYRGLQPIEAVNRYREFLTERRDDLFRRMTQISHLFAKNEPLPEELSVLDEYK